MTGELTAAIVGCGRIGGGFDAPADGPVTSHAQAYHRQAGIRLVAACDPSRERRDAFTAAWQVPTYATAAELLGAHQPEVVSICSPAVNHAAQVHECLEAGGCRLVLVEKPVCEHPEQLAQLTDHACRRGVPILVNHSRRFDPAHLELAADIAGGGLGPFIGGRADYYGGWLQNGTHLIDVLHMLLGPVTIAGVGAGAPGRNADDCPTVTVIAGGAPLRLDGFDEAHYQLFELDLRFERARVLIEDFGAVIRIQPMVVNGLGERVLAPAAERRYKGLQDPLMHTLARVCDYARTGQSLDGTGATLPAVAATMAAVWRVRDWRP